MPLQQRVPKRGFTNIFKKQIVAVNLKDLEERFSAGAVVTPEALIEAGLIKSVKDGVKVLAQGELTKALTVKVHAISKSAAVKVEAVGGKVEVL
jgi:large subunit ribosomal protein L15